jgi:hypothetical protein
MCKMLEVLEIMGWMGIGYFVVTWIWYELYRDWE